MDTLREKIEAAIRNHFDWPESEEKPQLIADDIMPLIYERIDDELRDAERERE